MRFEIEIKKVGMLETGFCQPDSKFWSQLLPNQNISVSRHHFLTFNWFGRKLFHLRFNDLFKIVKS